MTALASTIFEEVTELERSVHETPTQMTNKQ